jgi:hypothetical protein
MGLVANLRHQHQRGGIVPQVDLFASIGKDQLLQADLAPVALLDTDQQRQTDAQCAEDLARYRDLPLPTVHEYQIRHGSMLLCASHGIACH